MLESDLYMHKFFYTIFDMHKTLNNSILFENGEALY